MNEIVYKAVLHAHLACGLAALPLFWIPAVVRKGSRVHRAAGKLFLLAMLVVIVTGVPLAFRFLAEGRWVFAVFLLYIAVITAMSAGTAWFALRLKRSPARYFGKVYAATAVFMFLSGATVIALGWHFQVWLLFFFGVIGPFLGFRMLRKFRATEHDTNWWLHEHLGGMIGGGIATHVAFGAFGLRRLWPAYATIDGIAGMLPWLLPVVIGFAASAWLERRYANGLPRRKAVA